jgi:glutamate-1-semialdehyde 2,1-aminomutase
MFPDLPRNGHEAGLSIDKDLIAARRVYMANRGVWEAIWSAGTQVSFAHSRADLDRYLEVAEAFLAEIRC